MLKLDTYDGRKLQSVLSVLDQGIQQSMDIKTLRKEVQNYLGSSIKAQLKDAVECPSCGVPLFLDRNTESEGEENIILNTCPCGYSEMVK